jgi:hypothetical protein
MNIAGFSYHDVAWNWWTDRSGRRRAAPFQPPGGRVACPSPVTLVEIRRVRR